MKLVPVDHDPFANSALDIARRVRRVRRADGGITDDTGGVLPQINYNDANAAMKLNKQEQSLYQRHLENAYGPGGVDNPDGSRSTLYQAVQEHNGKYYNIPTVWGGKRETQPWTNPSTGETIDVPNQTALQNVERSGWDTFPSYDSPDEADARYNQMHGYMEKDTQDYLTPVRADGGSVKPRLVAVARDPFETPRAIRRAMHGH